MEKLFIFIKHNLKGLWNIIEFLNGITLAFLYRKKIIALGEKYASYTGTNRDFQFRLLTINDLDMLSGFLQSLGKDYIKYFNPHGFDRKALTRVLTTKNYLPFGYFHNDKLIGYFMLRLFANRRAFTGRVVDPEYNGRGIGKDMARKMYGMANELNWGVFGTASEKNLASLKTHNYEVVKKLPNGYLLIKYNTKSTNW